MSQVVWMRSDRGHRMAHAMLDGASLCGHPERHRNTLTPVAACDLTADGRPLGGNVCSPCEDLIARMQRAGRLLTVVP